MFLHPPAFITESIQYGVLVRLSTFLTKSLKFINILILQNVFFRKEIQPS